MSNTMKKRVFFLIPAILLLAFVMFSWADESGRTVYIDGSKGNDTSGTGDVSAPYKTVAGAFSKLGGDTGDLTVIISSDVSGSYIYVPVNKGINSLSIIKNSDDVLINSAGIFANGIPLAIGEGVTLSGSLYGGASYRDSSSGYNGKNLTLKDGQKITLM